MLYGHFNLNESSAAEAVKRTDVPILLIHGDEDRFVPVEMSRRIAERGCNIQLEIFPGGAHGISYLADTGRYKKIVLNFTHKYCTAKGKPNDGLTAAEMNPGSAMQKENAMTVKELSDAPNNKNTGS